MKDTLEKAQDVVVLNYQEIAYNGAITVFSKDVSKMKKYF